jgi:group I intron endonuclease
MAFIYILTNIINGKQYIGQTTRSIDVRLSEHLNSVKKNSNNLFHRAIRKYGIENFHIECLEVSDKLVNLWEKHLVKRWSSKSPNGYNLTYGGEGSTGFVHTEEMRRKNSIANKGRKSWCKGKKIPSLSKKYKGNGNPMFGKVPWNKGKLKFMEYTDELRLKLSKANKRRKSLTLIHPDGAEEKFECMRDACRKYDLNSGRLSQTLNGKRKSHKGYRGKYVS